MSRAALQMTCALLGLAILVGCEDDTARLLSELSQNERQSAQTSEQAAQSTTQPQARPPAPAIDIRPELPGGVGKYELVHEPGQARLKVIFADAQSPSVRDLSSAALSIIGPDGPVTVELEPCTPPEKGCLVAESPALRQPTTRGILRYQIGGRRFRAPVSTPKAASRPVEDQPPSFPERNP